MKEKRENVKAPTDHYLFKFQYISHTK